MLAFIEKAKAPKVNTGGFVCAAESVRESFLLRTACLLDDDSLNSGARLSQSCEGVMKEMITTSGIQRQAELHWNTATAPRCSGSSVDRQVTDTCDTTLVEQYLRPDFSRPLYKGLISSQTALFHLILSRTKRLRIFD